MEKLIIASNNKGKIAVYALSRSYAAPTTGYQKKVLTDFFRSN